MEVRSIRSLDTDVAAAVDGLVAQYKAMVTSGFTVQQLGSLVVSAAASVMRAIQGGAAALSPANQDALVLEAIGELFDQVAPLIDVPYVPEAIETRLVDPYLRKIILQLAAGAITSLRSIFDKTGWGTPTPSPVPAMPPLPVEPVKPVIPRTIFAVSPS